MADKPFHNPFSSLAPLRGQSREGSVAPLPQVAPSPPPVRIIPRAVVRLERSGRGGKEVTVVEQLQIPASERSAWLKALKSALGCGGVVEGDALVLQGDHRVRIPPLLAARGVKRVTVG